MNIYSKINSISTFTDSEKKIIDYVTNNLDAMIKFNAKDLAKKSFVSISTIYRILEKLELDGLNELKLKLIVDRQSYEKETEVDYNYPFQQYSTDYEIMSTINKLYQQTLESTFNLIDIDEFLKVKQLLKKANNIYIFPSIGNYFIAECFQQNMLEIGIKVDVIKERYYQHWTINAMQKGDTAIIISYANRTPHFIELAKQLKQANIPVILISSTNRTELSRLSDFNLYFASHEDSIEKITSFSSRISLQYLMDCLYASYFNSNYDHYLKHKINNYHD